VPLNSTTPTAYWSAMQEKQFLREEFRSKFRNISRIMDCVTCEKCRMWGKLQILGLGTAVKVLLGQSGAPPMAPGAGDGGSGGSGNCNANVSSFKRLS
jgi:hypothetical protein